jgi:hypothetical protein
MGVEYVHYLVVADNNWLPQPDTLARVDAVLKKWSLVGEAGTVYDLATMSATANNTIPEGDTGPGFAVSYRDTAQGGAVQELAGASYYDSVAAEDRYLQDVIAIAGADYRIQPSDEQFYFEVTSIQSSAGQQAQDIPYPISKAFNEYQAARASSNPPAVKIHLTRTEPRLHAWDQFNGFWRGAVVLDFGKDLPKFCESLRALPAREFVRELAEAFRGPLVEVSMIY